MPYLLVSAFFIISYTVMLIAMSRTELTPEKKRVKPAVIFVRTCVLLNLCSVPLLMIVFVLLRSQIWSVRAEVAAIITAVSVFLTGLFSLAQRYGAIHFKLQPVFDLEEIIFMTALPAVLLISYLPSTFIILYFLSPAIYTGYLMFRMIRERWKLRVRSWASPF